MNRFIGLGGHSSSCTFAVLSENGAAGPALFSRTAPTLGDTGVDTAHGFTRSFPMDLRKTVNPEKVEQGAVGIDDLPFPVEDEDEIGNRV